LFLSDSLPCPTTARRHEAGELISPNAECLTTNGLLKRFIHHEMGNFG
jgi:hypothetical protein